MESLLFLPTLSCCWEYFCEGGQHVLFRYVHHHSSDDDTADDGESCTAAADHHQQYPKGNKDTNKRDDSVIIIGHYQAVSSSSSSSSSPSSHQHSGGSLLLHADLDYSQAFMCRQHDDDKFYHDLFHGKLLRISKQAFRLQGRRDEGNLIMAAAFDKNKEWNQRMLQHLSPYVQLPITVLLSWTFILDLQNDVLSQILVIPPSRRVDWKRRRRQREEQDDDDDEEKVEKDALGEKDQDYSFSSHFYFHEMKQQQQTHINTTIDTRWIQATLIPDYRLAKIRQDCMIHSLHSDPTSTPISNTYHDSITVEIKPKAGYITKSPFIHPTHRNIKWNLTRYEIVRRLRNRHEDQSESSSSSTSFYCYNPMDLFAFVSCSKTTYNPNNSKKEEEEDSSSSSSSSWIYKANSLLLLSAVHTLFLQSTQSSSNLKIWHNDIKLIPVFPTCLSSYTKNDSSSSSISYVLQPIIMDSKYQETKYNVESNSYLSLLFKNGRLLESFLSFILLSEQTLLQKIIQLQKLDVLDADGAILVYDQLVILCQGDHNKAQTLIESALLFKTVDCLMEDSDDDDNYSSRFISSIEEDLSRNLTSPLQHLLRFSPYTFPSRENNHQLLTLFHIMDDFQSWLHNNLPSNSDINMMYKYSVQLDEVYNKSCYLISQLGIKDCVYLLQNWLLSLTMCDITIFINIIPGSVIINGNGTSMIWDYKIDIIDWDPKPAKKLQDLRKREEPLQLLSLSGD